MRKRILSIMLAICMVLTLMPQAAFAAAATSSTPGVSAYATKDQLMDGTFAPDSSGNAPNIGKIAFGKNSQGQAQEWFVLGSDSGVTEGTDNTIIFATSPIAKNLPFRSEAINDIPYDSQWGCDYGTKSVDKVAANHYGSSDLRKSLQKIALDPSYFTIAEQSMMNYTAIETFDLYNNKWITYVTTDKLYALQRYVIISDPIFFAIGNEKKKLSGEYIWNYNSYFWMREADADYNGGAYIAYYPEQRLYSYGINQKYDVRPAGNLNLTSVLFASAAGTASTDTAAFGTISSDKAMTLRIDGSSKNIGRVVYDITTGEIKAVKGSTSGNVALVVQGNDGTRDWYYSQKITGTQTIKSSTLKSALGLSAGIDLSKCKIWLETTGSDGMIYAVATDGCSTESELLDAINKGVSTVSLACDITLSGTLNLSDKMITLDLNGHTLKGNITLADTSAAPKSILTLIDSNPARGGRVDGRITLTRGSYGTASYLYANGGTVTGQVSMPSYVGGIYCTSSTPTVFKNYVGNYGEIHGGIFFGNFNEGCIKEKTVTFMNGSSRYALEVVAEGSKAAAPAEPAKDGYVFVGWYNGDTKFDFSQSITENLTLTAKWVSEDVSTEAELKEALALGSSFIRLTDHIALSGTLNLSDKMITLDLNGYALKGNITLADTSAVPKSILTLVDSNPAGGGRVDGRITLTRGSYGTASYLYANGGTVTGQVSMPSYVGGIYCTSSTPTVFTDYVGNYGEIHGGIFFGNFNEGCIKEKTVTFMNGSRRYALEVVADGRKVAEPIAPSVKDGYQNFAGWYDGETAYAFGNTLSRNITLTARFSDPITYNITCDLDGGTFDEGTALHPTSYTVESEAITLVNPTKSGCIFTGWSGTGLTGENNMTVTIPKGSLGDREYTAHYTARSGYSVVFDTNGGDDTISPKTGLEWGDPVLNDVTAPTKEGYTFKGWKCGEIEVNETTKYSDLAANDTVLEIMLTAQWERKNYTVTFNTDGGDAMSEKTDVKWTDKVLEGVTDPAKEGWDFIGWKCGEKAVTAETTYRELAPSDTAMGIELTAQWKEKTVPVMPTTCEIRIGEKSWTAFSGNITFDQFFQEEQTVTITASGSGPVTIEYLLSDRAFAMDELDEAAFTPYTGELRLDLNHAYVVYAKLTDASGNVTYINSDEIVLDAVAPVISGIESGKTYCPAHTVTVTELYLDSVTVNGTDTPIDENGQFTLSLPAGEKRVIATDKAGNVSAEMIVTVSDGHRDENADHKCDFCSTNVSSHEDHNTDHICDICGETLSEYTGGGGSGNTSPVQKPIVENDGNGTTNADLSGTTSTSDGTTTANIDKAIGEEIVDKAIANKSEEVVIDAAANTTTAADSTVIAQVGIPTDTLGAIAEKTNADITVKTDVAEVKLDNAATGAVAEQASGDTVQIIVEKVDETADKVEFQLKIVSSDGTVIRDFKGGNVAVTVAVPETMTEKDIVCIFIDDDGRMSKVNGQKNDDGTYTFITGHFSVYALMTAEEAEAAIAAQKEEIRSIDITLRSQQVKMKNGKKAIRLTWKTDSDVDFDGVEIFRSTKRYSGYGKKPIFTAVKDAFYNTAIQKGTKYYYKVRGFVIIDGQKYYTDWSLKAIRTVK